MVELLCVVLHDNISVSSNIRCLATLSSGVCCRLFNFIIETLQPVVLLVGLITLLKVVNDQLNALYENSIVQNPFLGEETREEIPTAHPTLQAKVLVRAAFRTLLLQKGSRK